jgi:N-acetylglucosamine malate deacetylase 2
MIGDEDRSNFTARLKRDCAEMQRESLSSTSFPPTTAIIVAHPDNETIGAGGQLPRLRGAVVVQVTDGAPRNMREAFAAGFNSRSAYAQARREELVAALALAGINPQQTLSIGVADREASFELVRLTQIVVDLLKELQPVLVLTHGYWGRHPDQDATAFAVHTACRLLRRQGINPPVIIEMASYYNRSGAMVVDDFLPADGRRVITTRLSEEQRELKRRMIGCFYTQRQILKDIPIEIERFRRSPGYDFTRPPHEGRLFYEEAGLGMEGEDWRMFARASLEAIGLIRDGTGMYYEPRLSFRLN